MRPRDTSPSPGRSTPWPPRWSVDLVGGFTALVQKGWTEGDRRLIAILPEVLSTTKRVCASVNVGTTAAGINMDAILALGHVLKDTAERTRDHDGFGCAKLVIFANAPTDNPFMAGAFHGAGEPDCVINIGVSGPGVVKAAVEDLMAHVADKPDARARSPRRSRAPPSA